MAVLLALCFLSLSLLASEADEMLPSNSKVGNWPSAESMQGNKKTNGEMLEALLAREEDKCYGKKCFHSEECCRGAACVDIEGISGTCLPIYGKKSYQPCEKDSDCGAGLACLESGNFSPSKTCQLEGRSIEKKGFRSSCATSIECDNANGLCCVGSDFTFISPSCMRYFDSKICIGALSPDAKPSHPAWAFSQPRLG